MLNGKVTQILVLASLLGACDSSPKQQAPPTVAPSVTATSSAAAAVPEGLDRIVARARNVALECRWTDEAGFSKCDALDSFTAKAKPGEQGYRAAATLLGDTDPRLRTLGATLWSQMAELEPPPDAKEAMLDAALAEQSPLLDRKLAMYAAGMKNKHESLRPKLEKLVRTTPTRVRATALSFLLNDRSEPHWAVELVEGSLSDPDPVLRLAALRGIAGNWQGAKEQTCERWTAAIADRDFDVRSYARRAVVGSFDWFIDDEKTGLVGARAFPFAQPCADGQITVAFASIDRDRKDKKLTPLAEASFFYAVSAKGPLGSSARPAAPTRKSLEHLTEAEKMLREIAKDPTKPKAARVIAIRGLRIRLRRDPVVVALMKDPDEAIAKAAAGD